MTINNTHTRIHIMRKNRVFSGCVQMSKWYNFSVTTKPRFAAKRISVAPESVFFIWFTGVFTMLIRLEVKNYVLAIRCDGTSL